MKPKSLPVERRLRLWRYTPASVQVGCQWMNGRLRTCDQQLLRQRLMRSLVMKPTHRRHRLGSFQYTPAPTLHSDALWTAPGTEPSPHCNKQSHLCHYTTVRKNLLLSCQALS